MEGVVGKGYSMLREPRAKARLDRRDMSCFMFGTSTKFSTKMSIINIKAYKESLGATMVLLFLSRSPM